MKTALMSFIAGIIVVFNCVSAYSQPSQDLVNRMMPKPLPASPNVASLGKFGDYQVSHFSGLPDISIPIYEIQSGSLKVPISLSYHAGGIKPTDVASWVGLGWSLSAGGQVARSVSGKPDEEYYSYNALNINLNNCGAPGTGTFYYMKNAATGVTDTEADVFSYSFGGRRGKFMLPYDSDPFLIPYAALDITPSPGLQKFEITDEIGILYRFGQNAQGVSCQEGTTATNGGNPTFSATTAWHLADIVAPNSNDQITFQYQNVGSYLHQDVSYSYVITDQCYAAPQGTCPTNSFSPQVHSNDSWGGQLGQSIITFETGKVKFILSDGFRNDETALKFLDRIEITDLDDRMQKTIKFNYSYFTDANETVTSLKLDAVEFKDKTGMVIQRYQFEYFTNSFSWDPTLANFRNARDLWGYYNGALANTDLILTKTIPYQATATSTPTTVTIGGASNRAVNTQFIKEGVLKKITFPTGGYTEFDYESNKYLDDNGVPTLAGGLRVKQIKSSDGSSSQPIIKTYVYGSDGSGQWKTEFHFLPVQLS